MSPKSKAPQDSQSEQRCGAVLSPPLGGRLEGVSSPLLSSLAHSRMGGKERQIRFASCKATAEAAAHALLGGLLLRRAAVVARRGLTASSRRSAAGVTNQQYSMQAQLSRDCAVERRLR